MSDKLIKRYCTMDLVRRRQELLDAVKYWNPFDLKPNEYAKNSEGEIVTTDSSIANVRDFIRNATYVDIFEKSKRSYEIFDSHYEAVMCAFQHKNPKIGLVIAGATPKEFSDFVEFEKTYNVYMETLLTNKDLSSEIIDAAKKVKFQISYDID